VAVRPVALVLRALGLGDLLTGVPALRAVRRALPGHELVLAAPRALRPLLPLTGAVDCLLPVPGLVPFDGPLPDVAVNLHGRGPESHALLVRLHPRRLVAFRCGDVDGPQWNDEEHEVRRWCRLVGTELGGDPDPTELSLALPETSPPVKDAIVIHPGAAYPARRWPAERFAEVAARMVAGGHPVVVTGSTAERPLADRVRRLALPASAVLAGRTTLEALAALIASARLLVCGDTGVAHLATAYATPSVVLYGPTPPSLWGPITSGPHEVLWRGQGSTDPWAPAPDPALLAISVDDVLTAAESALRGAAAAPAAPAQGGAGGSGFVT
jgi:ADP-heptose:LPS heptosyltransferase